MKKSFTLLELLIVHSDPCNSGRTASSRTGSRPKQGPIHRMPREPSAKRSGNADVQHGLRRPCGHLYKGQFKSDDPMDHDSF